MDPSKPSFKPNLGVGASGAKPNTAPTTAQPKTSFEATLAQRKTNVTTSKKPNSEPSAAESVLTAIAQAVDPNQAQLEAGLRIAEEQLAIQNARSVLQAPKPGKMQVQRERSDAEEEGGA